jgi:hypothetical protein
MGKERVRAQYKIPLELFNKSSYLVGAGIVLLCIAWLVSMFYINQFGGLAELGGFLLLLIALTGFFAIAGRYAYNGANQWVMRNVRCPSCEGAITSECDVTGRKGVMHCVLYCKNCKKKFFLGREGTSDNFNLVNYSEEDYANLVDSNIPSSPV